MLLLPRFAVVFVFRFHELCLEALLGATGGIGNRESAQKFRVSMHVSLFPAPVFMCLKFRDRFSMVSASAWCPFGFY